MPFLVASTAVRSKTVVLLLLLVNWAIVDCVFSRFAVTSLRKRELVVLVK